VNKVAVLSDVLQLAIDRIEQGQLDRIEKNNVCFVLFCFILFLIYLFLFLFFF
jgi:hypothetical protein